MKTCVGCNISKPYTEYYKSTTSKKDGYNRYCIQCCKVNRSLEAVRKRDRTSRISYRQEYRAKELGIHYEEGILLVEVFRTHRGICYICESWVAAGHASLDHIRPLSKGGTHTHDNIGLTHIKCNLRKSDKYNE